MLSNFPIGMEWRFNPVRSALGDRLSNIRANQRQERGRPPVSGELLRPPALGAAPNEGLLRADLREWLSHPDLIDLVQRFGGPAPGPDGLRLEELAEWTPQAWNFRAGRERNLVNPDTVTGDLEAHVLEAALSLGLVEARPPVFSSYDFVLLLGGLVRACMWRPEYAAHLLRSGLAADAVCALTGFRELNDAELELLPSFNLVGLEQEHQVIERSLEDHFGVTALTDTTPLDDRDPPNLRSRVAQGSSPLCTDVSLVVAPSSDPSRRANTPDSYAYWASEVAHISPGDRILMVTSPIYVPFQHMDAVRLLGLTYGCVIDTVGIAPGVVEEHGHPQIWRAVNYLQELNSTVRSLKLLHDTLANGRRLT